MIIRKVNKQNIFEKYKGNKHGMPNKNQAQILKQNQIFFNLKITLLCNTSRLRNIAF